jgi:hypothetical protein
LPRHCFVVGLKTLLHKADPMARASITAPASPLHCRSGFSRDALRRNPQKSIGRKHPPTKSRLRPL